MVNPLDSIAQIVGKNHEKRLPQKHRMRTRKENIEQCGDADNRVLNLGPIKKTHHLP